MLGSALTSQYTGISIQEISKQNVCRGHLRLLPPWNPGLPRAHVRSTPAENSMEPEHGWPAVAYSLTLNLSRSCLI